MCRRHVANSRGISLVEVMVALAILSTVLLSLSGMMWQMGRHTRQSGAAAIRAATMETAGSLAQSVSWDSLPGIVGCAADSTAQLQYTLCYEVQTITSRLTYVRVIVSPTAPATLLPDTMTVHRTKPRKSSPLHAL